MALLQSSLSSLGKLTSRPDGWRRSSWHTGSFETAYRPRTKHVSGEIASNRHLIMATLRGGARHHVFANADGQRHEGPDLAGSVSFLPAGCTRKLELHDVEWRWAAIALDASPEGSAASLARTRSLTVKQEAFVFSLLQEMDRLDVMSGGIEPIYAETMAGALAHYVLNRFGQSPVQEQSHALPPFKLRSVKEFIAANLDAQLSLSELAKLCDLSERHFHRAFKATVGMTPLDFVIRQRIERARLLLSSTNASIASIALAVGFANPGHFARAFSDATGMSPSVYRHNSSVN